MKMNTNMTDNKVALFICPKCEEGYPSNYCYFCDKKNKIPNIILKEKNKKKRKGFICIKCKKNVNMIRIHKYVINAGKK